jgi:hypothetical protein
MRCRLMLFVVLGLAGTALAGDATPRATAEGLVAYLLDRKTDIATDRAAQAKFLSAGLRATLAATMALVATSRSCPDAGPDEDLDNGTLLQSWDPPERCAVTKEGFPEPPASRVELLCVWGKSSNYPGTERQVTYLLVREHETWLVDDIRSAATRFNPRSSVTEDLAARQTEAKTILRGCSRK